MPRYVACRADEIGPGERKIVDVGGRSVGVFNVGGEYFALLNHCPHAGAPLCEGVLTGLVEPTLPGDPVRYSRRGEMLRCPWHQWEFDVRTGQSWFDPRRVRTRSYDVERVGDVPACSGDDGGPREGPHVAENYAVVRDGDVLIIDTGRRRGGSDDTQRTRNDD